MLRRAAAGPASDADPGSPTLLPGDGLLTKCGRFLRVFWDFLRPHTIRGTVLAACTVTARALLERPDLVDWRLLPRAALGVGILLAGNGYIIYDVDIDVVNKPWLPLAAGAMRPRTAWILCLGLAGAGLGLCATAFGLGLTALYATGLVLGTSYSVPPLRLKRSPTAACVIIATVRGFLLNYGVYLAARGALGLPFAWNPTITFTTCVATMFAGVIALTKDLPDIAGDRAAGIDTLASRLGTRRLMLLGSGLLDTAYAVSAVVAAMHSDVLNAPLICAAHATFACALTWSTRRWADDVAAYYRSIWWLFYAEYTLVLFL